MLAITPLFCFARTFRNHSNMETVVGFGTAQNTQLHGAHQGLWTYCVGATRDSEHTAWGPPGTLNILRGGPQGLWTYCVGAPRDSEHAPSWYICAAYYILWKPWHFFQNSLINIEYAIHLKYIIFVTMWIFFLILTVTLDHFNVCVYTL